MIEKVTDSQGNVIYQYEEPKEEAGGFPFFSKKETNQLLKPALTYILTDMMKGMFDQELNGYMSVTGASIADQLTHDYAGKSGTTESDSWMVGFSLN